MLPKCYREYDRDAHPRIQKTVSGEDASTLGAFSFGTVIQLTLHVPRRLGAAGVVLRLAADGESDHDLPLTFESTEWGVDTYKISLDTATLCGARDYGLFYYEFLFIRGCDTLFTNSINNVDFTLSEYPASRFRLLVHSADFTTPDWFSGGTMYHIFVDRFCRGQGPTYLREDATLDPDWEHGIPQYAAYPGAPLANNRFFGGNLWGVAEKLEYLHSLGVTVLYLSPIFEAASNHKYDTGDYETVDAAFGGEEALAHLLKRAKKHGIRIILDGVFNHTGDDSRYFNRYGRYGTVGAYQSPHSPYASWYSFKDYAQNPDDYTCWWDIPILPRLNGTIDAIRDYLAGPDGIAAQRVRQGIAGWRLDVVDELSDDFLDTLRQSVHATAKDQEQPILIGEVWENAADKLAYGKRRRYFAGRQLDSVMNYPLRNGILSFVRDGDAESLYHVLTELYSSYPRAVCHSLMNVLGTHDTERILTVLGDPNIGVDRTNDELASARLTPEQRAQAIRRLLVAQTLQFTVFGIPSVFYGDEAGMEGHHDPFCRMPYPWTRQDPTLLSHVTFLGRLRQENRCFKDGDFRMLHHGTHTLAYERRYKNNIIVTAANMGTEPWTFASRRPYVSLTSDGKTPVRGNITIPAGEALLLQEIVP